MANSPSPAGGVGGPVVLGGSVVGGSVAATAGSVAPVAAGDSVVVAAGDVVVTDEVGAGAEEDSPPQAVATITRAIRAVADRICEFSPATLGQSRAWPTGHQHLLVHSSIPWWDRPEHEGNRGGSPDGPRLDFPLGVLGQDFRSRVRNWSSRRRNDRLLGRRRLDQRRLTDGGLPLVRHWRSVRWFIPEFCWTSMGAHAKEFSPRSGGPPEFWAR